MAITAQQRDTIRERIAFIDKHVRATTGPRSLRETDRDRLYLLELKSTLHMVLEGTPTLVFGPAPTFDQHREAHRRAMAASPKPAIWSNLAWAAGTIIAICITGAFLWSVTVAPMTENYRQCGSIFLCKNQHAPR